MVGGVSDTDTVNNTVTITFSSTDLTTFQTVTQSLLVTEP
jgi:hypothetical protein